MNKTAVILADGCEEGESLTIVDIMRRAELPCDLVGLTALEVTGAHDITMRTDKVLDESIADYDMIVLPGGYGGTENMKNSELLCSIIRKMFAAGKYVTAMCAAPQVLDKCGVLEGRTFTCYPTVADKIKSGNYVDGVRTVVDGNIVTSAAPGTAYAFGYKLVDVLGGDSLAVKKRMVYFNAFDVQEDE